MVVSKAQGKVETWMKVIKRYKLPVIRQINTRHVMYNMMTIVNTAV